MWLNTSNWDHDLCPEFRTAENSKVYINEVILNFLQSNNVWISMVSRILGSQDLSVTSDVA